MGGAKSRNEKINENKWSKHIFGILLIGDREWKERRK